MPRIRQILVVSGVAALAMAALVAGAPAAAPKTADGSESFDDDGTFVVPAGVTSITVEAWGAQGGDGGLCTILECNTSGGEGGEGAHVTATIAVTPGETLDVVVGEEGAPGTELVAGTGGDGYGEGGNGGTGGSDGDASGAGGGGGGASAVSRSDDAVVVAAGGGGGGGEGANAGTQPDHGGVGGESAEDGQPGELPCAGQGGEAGDDAEAGDGGAGGQVACLDPGTPGSAGDESEGGDGGQNVPSIICGAGGGGGGGGLGGGGGGGAGGEGGAACNSGGGGGGGSSLAPDGSIDDGVRDGDGKVLITWSATGAVEPIEVEPTFTG